MWATEGIKTAPASNTVLADTGVLAAGPLPITILAWTTGGGWIDLAHRNALNTADVHVQRLFLTSNPQMPFVASIPLVLVINERFVIRTATPWSGDVQVSLLA